MMAGPRILVVDDDPDLRRAVREGLAGLAERVFEARDGLEALEVAERETPDLVVSDAAMPRLSGPGLARILADRTGPPVLLMGSLSEAAAELSGAVGVLRKPFDRLALRRSVRRALGVH